VSLSTLPIPVKRAKRWVEHTHRRLPELTGGMWAVGALQADVLVGVAVVGRPNARMSDTAGKDAPQPNLEVLRVASLEGVQSRSGHKVVNSILYGACSRAARAMGARNLFTYIHKDEAGVSLRAANWVCLGEAGGGEWDRDMRPRQTVIDSEAKLVWFAPWSEKAKGHATTAALAPIPPPQPSPSAESGGSGALATGDTARTAWGGAASEDLAAGDGAVGVPEASGKRTAPAAEANATDEVTHAVAPRAPRAAAPAHRAAAAPRPRLDIRLVDADGSERPLEVAP
jgi:hypothetical protein